MDLTSKNRKELTNLQDPIQLSELNKQLRWLFTQVMGGLPLKALDEKAKEFVESRIGSDQLNTVIEQTDEKIALEAARVDGHLANFTVRADGIEAKAVAADGKAASAQLTANGASTTASDAYGKSTQALQTANEFSYKLRDPTYNHEVRIGNHRQGPAIKFYAHGSVDADSSVSADSGYIDVYGAQQADLTGGGTQVSAVPGRMTVNAHIAPNDYAHGVASLGTRAEYGEYRFRNVNITGSVDSSSDRRLKRDISDLDTDLLIDLLHSLRPRAFRMIADGEDGKMRWGFVAQEVKEALEALGITGVEFLDDDNPDHLALCYTELVAVLVKGWQEQQRKIDAMEGQIYALEKRLAALEVTRDDRR